MNDDGQVIHADQNGIHASWSGFDHESNINGYFVAIGTSPNDTSITNGFREYGLATSGYIDGIRLDVSSNGTLYYVLVKTQNKAGSYSNAISSNPIYVYEENVAGQVFDGRNLFVDQDYSNDTHSVGISFMGFESAACGIISYDWGLGSHPGFSDITPFSSFGLVMINESHGQAQLHIPLENGMTIYTTVRAHTGYKCHESIIESSSDGLTIDINPPNINIESVGIFANYTSSSDLYQDDVDTIIMEWNSTDDESRVLFETWMAGSHPYHDDFANETYSDNGKVPLGDVSMNHGNTVFFTITSIDSASNVARSISPSLTVDTTPPDLQRDLSCTKFISHIYPFITCTWDDPIDNESPIDDVAIAIGLFQFDDSFHEYTSLSHGTTTWTQQVEIESESDAYTQMSNFVVTLTVINRVGLVSASFAKVVVDQTPPIPGSIQVTTPLNPDEPVTSKICQMSTTTMQLHIYDFKEGESEINR